MELRCRVRAGEERRVVAVGNDLERIELVHPLRSALDMVILTLLPSSHTHTHTHARGGSQSVKIYIFQVDFGEYAQMQGQHGVV